MASTRIREIRKDRGMTLQHLAELAGTTAQTIQRLETGTMTVSIDWLERIARALQLMPADLLRPERSSAIPYLGDLSSSGEVTRGFADDAAPEITLDVPADDPVAVKLTSRIGPHEAGTILIAGRLDMRLSATADGRDCLVALADGALLFRRIVFGSDGQVALVPYESAHPIRRNPTIEWLAPILMSVRYL